MGGQVREGGRWLVTRRRSIHVHGHSSVVVGVVVVSKGMADGNGPSMGMRDRVADIVPTTIAVVLASVDILDYSLGVRSVIGFDSGSCSGSGGGKNRRRIRQGVEIGTLSWSNYRMLEHVSMMESIQGQRTTRCNMEA